jgi:hypothetical protein
VFELLLLIVRAIVLTCRGHQEIVLENSSRRSQRTVPRAGCYAIATGSMMSACADGWRRSASRASFPVRGVPGRIPTSSARSDQCVASAWIMSSSVNETHLRRILRAYLAYYHRSRTHLGLNKDAPDCRPTCVGRHDHRDAGSRRLASPLHPPGGVGLQRDAPPPRSCVSSICRCRQSSAI